MYKVGLIGAGNMATAMIGGMVQNHLFRAEEIVASARTEEKLAKLHEKYGISVTTDNKVCADAEIVFLCVKPVRMADVLAEIAPVISEDTLVVSIAAGKKIAFYENGLAGETGKKMKIVRCMPNTPALVGEGFTGVSVNEKVTGEEKERVLTILRSFGEASVVPESMMDAVVGISGSGPAYVYMFIDAMAKAGVAAGLERDYAIQSACKTVLGAAKMVQETGEDPEILKQKVCSPGGTTIEAVQVFENRDLYGVVKEAIDACIAKSEFMSK